FKQLTGTLGKTFANLSPQSQQSFTQNLTNVSYLGFESDGKHYKGELPSSAFDNVKQKLFSSLGQNAAAVTYKTATVEAWIDPSTGRATREVGNVQATLDLDTLTGGQASGKVGITTKFELKAHDVGKPVTVTKPTASGTASTLQELGS